MPWLLWVAFAAAEDGEEPFSVATAVDPFSESDEVDLLRAEQGLITVASRYAQTIRQAPSIVTVVTDEEIRRRGYRTLADVLRGIPGVYLSVAKEGRTLGWLRGVSSPDNNKILLLVDGVPIYDGVYAHAWLDEYIPLSHVRQVEIIKGPGSVLYGTNAFGGVINVVTYGAEDVQGAFARAEGGSFHRRGVAVVAGQRLGDRGSVRAAIRVLDTEGDGLDRTPNGGYNIHGSHPRQALHAGLTIDLDALTIRYDHIDYAHSYLVNSQDSLFSVFTSELDALGLRYNNDFFSARYDIRPSAKLEISPYLYAQNHNNPGAYGYTGGVTSSEIEQTVVDTIKHTARYGIGTRFRNRWSMQHVTIGGLGVELDQVLLIEDRVFSGDSGEPLSPSSYRAGPDLITDGFGFVQHSWTASWWLELMGGLRMDAHSHAGQFASPRLGALLVTDSGVLKLLYGRAFRAPSARELLVNVVPDENGNNPFTSGNPNLSPETIDTVEVEFSGDATEQLALRGALYASSIQDEIARVSNDGKPKLGDVYYDNVAGSQILGAEGEFTFRLTKLEVTGNHTLTRAIDTQSGNAVYEYPVHMTHLQVDHEVFPGLWLSGQMDYYGRRPRAEWSPDAGLSDGSPFGLLHAALSTGQLADGRLRLDLSVRNLLNNNYETLIPAKDANALTENDDGSLTAKYPQDLTGPGRDVVVGIEVQF